VQLKQTVLAVLDAVRDESSKDAPVRLVFEPKSRAVSQEELANTLLVHTSLETSAPVNLTSVGLDGRPVQKSLRQMLDEWIAFRQQTLTRRSEFRLRKVLERIHILEGRQLVLLNIDEVIAIIREADEPRAALVARFHLSERQADDILDIRLRQLARLEAIRIEQELAELRQEQGQLEDILASPAALRRLMAREIERDAKEFGDARRTLIQAEKRAVAEVKVADEPVTVVISEKGWVRARTGHGHDAAGFSFKAGDGLYGTFECRTVDQLLAFGGNGRVYSVPVASLPGARGDGQPITTLIELEAGTEVLHYFAGAERASLLLSSSAGYGFVAHVADMLSRTRGGKAFMNVGEGEHVCRPSIIALDFEQKVPQTQDEQAQTAIGTIAATHVACVSTGGRILTFGLGELKRLEKGGRGLTLMALEAGDALAGAAAYVRSVRIAGVGRGGKAREEQLEIRSLNNAGAARGRKGKAGNFGFKPDDVTRVL
jgi:topoisomerase-4 subunit A